MRPPNTRALLFSIAILVIVCTGAWIVNTLRFTQPTPLNQQEAETAARLCANLEYGNEEIPLPIVCTLHIGNGETAEFTFEPDGGLIVKREDKTLLVLKAENEDSSNTHTAALAYSYEPVLRPDGFVLQDITFDGYADLQVMTFAGAYNFGYDFYAYNPKTHTFGPEPILKELVNPGVDTEKKEIAYFYKGRGLADSFFAGTYRFIDGAYILVETVEQDIVTDYDDPNPLYERVTSQLQNGILTVTKKETLTAKDVWGE